jgi:hypothetical protein
MPGGFFVGPSNFFERGFKAIVKRGGNVSHEKNQQSLSVVYHKNHDEGQISIRERRPLEAPQETCSSATAQGLQKSLRKSKSDESDLGMCDQSASSKSTEEQSVEGVKILSQYSSKYSDNGEKIELETFPQSHHLQQETIPVSGYAAEVSMAGHLQVSDRTNEAIVVLQNTIQNMQTQIDSTQYQMQKLSQRTVSLEGQPSYWTATIQLRPATGWSARAQKVSCYGRLQT